MPRDVVQRLARDVLDLLFPPACVGCGRYGGERGASPVQGATRLYGASPTPLKLRGASRWLCMSCRERIEPLRPTCVECGTPAPTGRTCYDCLRITPLAGVVAVGPYRDPILRAAIHQLKFSGVRALAEPLADLLAPRVIAAGIASGAVLVPLPLHRRRERARGFNQAHLLASELSRILNLPVVHLLVRRRAASPQTSLRGSPQVRRRNVTGAFSANGDVDLSTCDRLILVDDVLTTGATLDEAAHVLAAAGAREVWAAVLARAASGS